MPMQNITLIGLSRQISLHRELEVVANNIANIDTTGYKADGVTATTTVSQIRAIKCQVQVTLPRETGGARTITAWAWLRAW
jgi:flagellar basal body rod protein FlgG